MHNDERAEGLDERGEAPPPYAPGSKPPSIRSADERRASTRAGSVEEEEAVELARMSGETNNPPIYHNHATQGPEDGVPQVTSPPVALNRSGSMRISSSSTEVSSNS